MNTGIAREQFPILQHKVYLNSCSYGALAEPVRAAMQSYLDDRDNEGARWDYWVGCQEQLRTATAELLAVKFSEIALGVCQGSCRLKSKFMPPCSS